jgi:pimeloyl-ACP methyl ester carboxylesterase
VNDLRLRPVEVLGFRGRYAVAGNSTDPPAVLLTSPLVRAEAYTPTVEHLARHMRVVAVEMPGGGRAGRVPVPWTLGDYAGWVAGLIDALGLAGATVVGHSHAGGVALLLPVLHPARAGRVAAASPIGAGGPFALWRVLLGRVADTLTVEFAMAARRWSTLAYAFAAHTRNFWRQVRASLDADLTGYAARVNVPVLVAWGRRDHTLPPRCAAAWARHLPDAAVYVSPRGSHGWPITHPAEFAGVVAAWARQTEADQRAEAARRAVAEAARPVTVIAAPRPVATAVFEGFPV